MSTIDKQVLYDGRWVDREHFCVYVYNSTGIKLVKSYDEFCDVLSSGAWFATKEDALKPQEDNVVKIKKRSRK